MKPIVSLTLTLIALVLLLPGLCRAQEKKARPKSAATASASAEEKSTAAKKAPAKKPAPSAVKILVEWIEIEQADLTEWLMENRLENDATKVRRELQEAVEDGEASIVETVIVASRSGQRAKAESVREIIYPTAFDPAEIPVNVKLGGKTEAPFTPPNPTAYETRNVGVTVEVDPVISADGKVIDLNIVPEIVEYLGDRRVPHEDYPEEFQVAVPDFHTASVTNSVSVPNGGYVLLGTVHLSKPFGKGRDQPILLVFVRADASY